MGLAARSVGLVVTCYERTYRQVLTPGFFPGVLAANRRGLDEVVALINNVDDPADARARAEALRVSGEITSYAFVADHLDRALARARLPRRVLRSRPYLLDYGLVMPHVVDTDWLLGWDAETRLVEPTNWVDPSLDLMTDDRRVFHTSLAWPPAGPHDPGLAGETIGWADDFALNWGFSDQVFLLRRDLLVGPVFRAFAPAAMARHAPHPHTFEYRVEAHQRARGHLRATLSTCRYETNPIEDVISRTGETPLDSLRRRALRRLELRVLDRLPDSLGPRWRKNASLRHAHPL